MSTEEYPFRTYKSAAFCEEKTLCRMADRRARGQGREGNVLDERDEREIRDEGHCSCLSCWLDPKIHRNNQTDEIDQGNQMSRSRGVVLS